MTDGTLRDIGIVVWTLVAALYGGGIFWAIYATSPQTPPRPTISPVDHPRCFPEGTEVPLGFAGCPDNAPKIRSA